MLWQAFGRWGAIGGGGGTPPHLPVGSYLFGSNAYMEMASAPFTVEPFTLVCWMRPINQSTQALFSIGNSAATSRTQLDKRNFGGGCGAVTVNSGGTSGGALGGTFANNTWTHVAGVFTSSTNRDVYVDGVLADNDTQSIILSGLNSLLIGSRYSGGSRGAFFEGHLGHPAAWDSPLSAGQVAALAGGDLPSSIPSNLVFYAKLADGVAVDAITGTPLTVSGATYDAAETPPI